MKPLGDREEAKGQNTLLEQSFGRKFMAKHGWHCFMIDKRTSDV